MTPEPAVPVVLIVASVRSPRVADVLLPWLTARLRSHPWLELEVVDLARVDLPVGGSTPGGGASPISGALAAADAFVVLVPEYNHSFPAALKTAIDWHSVEWRGKPVSFVGYGASSGGIRAVEQLRLVFPELRAATTRNAVHLVAPWEHVDEAGVFTPPAGADAALDATLTELHWWARALRAGRDRRGVPA